jgi:RNA polymerase sigma factor (sigma-70 family)
MSNARGDAVLGYIRKLVADRKDLDLPDHQLLDRFAAQRDETAFAALLKRHGPMVLSVCQSILHNLHDAEDAFQAVFLILARKAGSIHRREAVSSWLHRVAYHLAVRTQADAARRRVLEKRAVTMPSADPVLDLSLRELRTVVNEELQRLPEAYRAPLVLCCLEEKSLEEAGRLLGWSQSTVKGRLQRGRERLRARLRRRGLELSVGVLASVVSTNFACAQISAKLSASTLKAALWLAAGKGPVAGVISAKVAALVQGASNTMFTSKATIATVLFLATSVAVVSGVALHTDSAAGRQAPEQNQAGQQQNRREGSAPVSRHEPAAEDSVMVRGRVLDTGGKPLAGAKLYLATFARKGPVYSEQARSGPDGRFKFSISKSELDTAGADHPAPQVMAVAEGHGCDWAKVGRGAELTLRLVKDVPINGRILDADGKPVAGAKLKVMGVSAAKGEDLENFLKAIRLGPDPLGWSGLIEVFAVGWFDAFALGWVGPLVGQPTLLTTDADGRFKLAGAGGNRVVSFRLEGPAIGSAYLAVSTRSGEKVGNVYGASFDYLAVASRTIRGVVRDKDTAKPLAGVSVRINLSSWRGDNRWATAVTDKEGRYELPGLAKSPSYPLVANPPDGLYFQRWVDVRDTEGLAALTADIELVRGLTVRGKVTDKATGKPIAKARVYYHPISVNPNVNKKLPGMWFPSSEATTAPDGSYALTVFPGPGVIGVSAPKLEVYMAAWLTLKERKDFFKVPIQDAIEENLIRDLGGTAFTGGFTLSSCNAVVLLEPSEKDESLVRDVALEPARTLKGSIVGPDGQPVAGVTVLGLREFGVETLKGSQFTVRGINPKGKRRQLVFHQKEKNLGFLLEPMRGDVAEPLTIKLQECGSAAGRIVDQDGQPVAGWGFNLFSRLAPTHWIKITTDKEGRFRLKGLVPGLSYILLASQGQGLSTLGEVVVEPGKQKDMGDIKIQDK